DEVGAREHRQPDDVHVLLNRRLHDLLWRPLEPGVDDLDPRVAERLRHDLRAAVVAVEPRLGDQDFHCIESRWAGTTGGRPSTRCAPAAFRMSLLIPPSSAGPALPVGGPRRGAPRLRSACHFSFHRPPLGRRLRWVARDEVRPGCVPHVTSHSTELRWAGAFGGWPATRCAPAAFRMSLLIPAKGLMFRT